MHSRLNLIWPDSYFATVEHPLAREDKYSLPEMIPHLRVLYSQMPRSNPWSDLTCGVRESLGGAWQAATRCSVKMLGEQFVAERIVNPMDNLLVVYDDYHSQIKSDETN